MSYKDLILTIWVKNKMRKGLFIINFYRSLKAEKEGEIVATIDGM